MNWYLDVLKKYTLFTGRARRKEFWMFVLINFIIALVLNVIGALIKFPVFGLLYSLAVLLPSIAVGIRRLHDTSRSGWWLLIAFIPLVGAIWLIVLYAQDSTPGDNMYGPNPKGA